MGMSMTKGFLFERMYQLFPSKDKAETILKMATTFEHLLGAQD